MTKILIAQKSLIDFILQDDSGAEVIGLGTAFTVLISKNGGAFAAGIGTKAEISHGWYRYELTADDTDTAGPLAIDISAIGAVQTNLIYEVVGTLQDVTNAGTILTAEEAAIVLRCGTDDPDMLQLLPLIDAYLYGATGYHWEEDFAIQPQAKSAARILLALWHENPAMVGYHITSLDHSLTATLSQLEAMALRIHKASFTGRIGAGECRCHEAEIGDHVTALVGIVGASGDASASFESVITVEHQIQQISGADLSANRYRVSLMSAEDYLEHI